MKDPNAHITHVRDLRCSNCHKIFPLRQLNTFSPCCTKPLLAEYALNKAIHKAEIITDEHSIWRYSAFLPVLDKKNIISLGEGMTPISRFDKAGKKIGVPQLYIKDETYNPTGSFKARGMSVAISKAKELNVRNCIVPTAGNAGGAMAAYCAKAGIACTVVMPVKTPAVFMDECRLYGADVLLVEGLINECGKKVAELMVANAYFDVSTLKEPYRLEGKKTMGYEIAEQFNWNLPDVIIYPAGGGTGLIGIWKAFREMLSMGWVSSKFPRMMAVQSANCAPIAAAIKNPSGWTNRFTPQPSIANGLAVPFPFGMDLILSVLSESGGEVCVVTDAEIIAGVKEIAKTEGVILSPEGSATYVALRQFLQSGKIKDTEKVLLLNTGSGYKYFDNL